MKKKILALVLALVMVLSLAACGNSGENNTQSPESQAPASQALPQESVEIPDGSNSAMREKLTIAGSDDPATLDPWAGTNGGFAGTLYMIYETLCISEFGSDQLDPVLAKSWEREGNIMTIELFDNIVDSAGNPFTANDVKFSLDKCLEEGLVAYAKILADYEVTGDYTVKLTLNDNLAVGDVDTFLTNVYFMTEAAYNSLDGNLYNQAIGTGRYSVESFDPNSSWTFVLRDNYWQTDESQIASRSTPHVERLEYTYAADASTRAMAAQTGAADVAMMVTYTDLPSLENVEGIKIHPYQMSLTRVLMPNCDPSSPMSDLNVRKAVFYALSNEGIAATFTSGTAIPVYDMANSNYSDYYEDYYKQLADEGSIYKYDPELAKQLLAEAGYNDSNPLTLRLITSSDTAFTDVATAIISYLEQVGIKCTMQTYSTALLADAATDASSWDLYMRQTAANGAAVVSWARPLDPAYYATGMSCNHIDDDKLYDMLHSVVTDAGHTEEAVKECYKYIVDNAYGYGIFVTEQYMAIPEDCTFVSMNLSIMPSFSSWQFSE